MVLLVLLRRTLHQHPYRIPTILTESEEFEMMKEWDMQLPPPMPSCPKIHSSASMFGMFYGVSNSNVQIIQYAPSPVNDKVDNNKQSYHRR